MEFKNVLRSAGLALTPACACLIITAGCATESEIPLPPGAYVAPPARQVPPENSALSTEPAPRPAPREFVSFPKDSDEQVFTLERLSESEAPERSAPAPRKTVPAKKARPVFAKDDIIYKIRKNDTLGGIAHRYGMTAPALADYNGISLKSKIYPGKTLHIPVVVKSASKVSKAASPAVPAGASVYTVRSGDTLGGIAQKHSVRTAELVAANDLDVRKPIRAGQKLIIPASAQKAVPAAAAEPAKKTTTAAKPGPAKPAPAAKPGPAKKTTTAAKPEPAKPAPAEKAESAPARQRSADDLLKSIGSDSVEQTGSAPAAPAAKPEKAPGSVSVAPPAREEAFDADNTIEVNIEREMTLEETAKAFDRSYSTVKKLNPSISPDVRLKAGTAVKIPIF